MHVRREKLGTAEGRILELDQQMTDLEAAKAAAEAAVQEHLIMREKQTERIRKAKAAGAKGESTPNSSSPSPPLPQPRRAPFTFLALVTEADIPYATLAVRSKTDPNVKTFLVWF